MQGTLIGAISALIAFILALTIHEFCHALTAHLLGDDTPKRMGRLTLNPLAHIDPLGLLFLILVRIGWAKPVSFNPQNFSRPRLYSVLVGLAGPASNFALALIFMYASRFIPPYLSAQTAVLAKSFFTTSVWINVMLGIFNLIPIPPLDGSHIIYANLPEKWKPTYNKLMPLSIILLLILINVRAFRNAFQIAITQVVKFLHSIVF